MTTQTPDAVREAVDARVEIGAKALGLHRIPGGNGPLNPPTRWPTGPQDTLSGRDGTVPLTWGFAEQCRSEVRAILAALGSRADHDRLIYEQGRRDACEDHDIAIDIRSGDPDAAGLRDFADRVMEAAADCCTDPDAGPDSQTSVSFTGEEGARLANDLHRLIDSRAGDAREGWKLVPVEPTEAMLDAYWKQTGESKEMRSRTHAYMRRYWSAMLAATPAPAVDAQEGDDEGPCTDCEDTGITTQTERACSCEAGDQYRAPAVDAVPAGEMERLREAAAKVLYDSWSDQTGWVPWVERGNSIMQERARREVML